MKNVFLLLLLFQFNTSLGQKTLEEVLVEIQEIESYYSSTSYVDDAGEMKGISIHNEQLILDHLQLDPIEYGEYFLTGKYEINGLIVVFIANYADNETSHFALLLDGSLHLIDRLEETAYWNAEGSYDVDTYIAYNIVTITTYHSYRVPNYVNKKYTITNNGFQSITDQVIVDIPSGCRIYKEPSTNSASTTRANQFDKFDYLGHDYQMDSAKLAQDGYLMPYWLEVAKKDSFERFGFIFEGFAKRHIQLNTNEYNVEVDEITQEEFLAQEIKRTKEPTVEKITDVDEIKKMLKKNITLEYNEEYGYHEIQGITADNGKKIDLYWFDYGVKAYFPKYHYVLLEGGHSMEDIIDLKNGDNDIGRIGNPGYYLPSPNGAFRMNGYYSGQSFVHFLEKNNERGAPEYLFSISELLALDFIETFFWTEENTLLLKIGNTYYSVRIEAK